VSEFSVPPAATVPDEANLTDAVWDNAETRPEAPQFIRMAGTGWTEVGCRQFRDEVLALARGLLAAGMEPGARIGLLSRTRYEWTLIDYAILAAGAVTVPMYETSSADQVAWILSDSGATACFVETDEHAAMMAGLRDRLPALREMWRIDAGDLGGLTARGDAVDPAEIDARRRAISGHDLATVIYTSGTTGRPKGCMLTHRNMSSGVTNAVAALPDLFKAGASTVLSLPLAHAFARLIQLGTVQTRTTMGHVAEVSNLTDELQRLQPTFLLSVPRVFEKLHSGAAQKAQADGRGRVFGWAERVAVAYSEALERPSGPGLHLRLQRWAFDRLVYRKLRAALGGRCRHAIAGGAPLNVRLGHFFRGAGITVLEGYGLTETSAAGTVNRPDALRMGTVGQPLPGIAVRVDPDGEILLKGDVMFQGYWNAREATDAALTIDGWFRTGDLGELDGDGFLRITGRKKEMIVTAAGKHVVPAMLEERVRAHSPIGHAVVVGDRRPFVGALVTIDREVWPRWLAEHGRDTATDVEQMRDDPTLRADVQGAIDDANAAVSHPEAVKKFRILPDDFTETNGALTPTLKVKRDVVQDRYAREIDAIYSG
jgi:long-chain acyl-CoA synthetase